MIASSVPTLTGKKVLVLLLGFFGVVAAVNAVFLYFALATHPGADTEDAYRRGLAYNRVLRDAAAQEALGWRGAIEHDAAGGVLRVTVSDAKRRPIPNLTVTAKMRRAVTRGNDFQLAFEETRPGRYRVALDPPLPGRWLIRVRARDRSGRVYRVEKQIWSE